MSATPAGEATVGERAPEQSAAGEELVVTPCRPYRIGQHARSLRIRMIATLVVGAVVGGIAAGLVGIGVVATVPGVARDAAFAASELVILPACILLLHWALIGPARWRAIQILVWTSRFAASGYLACTGIRSPTDRRRTREWLASSTHVVGEEPDVTYWRAYAHLLLGETDAARAQAALITDSAWAYPVAALTAQIDLAEGLPMPVGRLLAQVRSMPDSEERAVAAGELGAMTAQAAWTCGTDDVRPVLEIAPLVEPYASGFMLRAYWLPVTAAVVVMSVAFALI
jgi:hypothetical protein